MATEKIILAKDELQAAKLKLIKSWLKLCFKGKKRIKRPDLELGFGMLLDNTIDNEFCSILDKWGIYNFVFKLNDLEEDYYVLNSDIDDIKILTPHVGAGRVPARNDTGRVPARNDRGRKAEQERALDEWIQELEKIQPSYIDLNEPFEP